MLVEQWGRNREEACKTAETLTWVVHAVKSKFGEFCEIGNGAEYAMMRRFGRDAVSGRNTAVAKERPL